MLFAQHELRATAQEMQTFSHREKGESAPERAIDNFVQFYWHNGNGWSQERCRWFHYRGDEWVTASFQVDVQNNPIHLRLDPSVHIGIVELRSIRITDCDSKRDILLCDKPEDWPKIDVQGTFSVLQQNNTMVCFSYGNDPQFLLPYCEKIVMGTCIELTIVFREMGIRQFLGKQHLNHYAGKNSLLTRMLRKLI